MNKKTAKSTIVLLMLLVISLYFIAHTYAKYTGTATGSGEIQVAKWSISVGDAHNGQKMKIQFNQVENEHVVDKRIAPNTEMYADLIIDPTGTEVSIDYTFKIGAIKKAEGSQGDEAVPQNLKVTKVCYLEGDADGKELDKKSDGTYYGSILLGPDAKTALTEADSKKVRVYAKWEDSKEYDENDSKIARRTQEVATPTYEVEITAHAEQHIGV